MPSVQQPTSSVYQEITELLLQNNDDLLAMGIRGVGVTDPYTRHRTYKRASDRQTYLLYGQIASEIDGTLMSARGNHYLGSMKDDAFYPITDHSTIKDVLVLERPSAAPRDLKDLFDDQIIALEDVVDHEAEEHYSENRVILQSWVKSGGAQRDSDRIIVHMAPKYGVEDTVTMPTLTDLQVGDLHDPELLEDYGGPLFQHHTKLVQLDVKDKDNSLIPPWKMYDKLRTGTVVLINATLHMFNMDIEHHTRLTYQVHCKSLRVLAESDLPVVPRLPFRPRKIPRVTPADLMSKGFDFAPDFIHNDDIAWRYASRSLPVITSANSISRGFAFTPDFIKQDESGFFMSLRRRSIFFPAQLSSPDHKMQPKHMTTTFVFIIFPCSVA
ncbi:hypothetical protein FPV67DRAFT_1666130 [Lyophyllum atratum]|nr:hypothetical protein FPV67DRAFT_1666130 [Lyophyllum atratum]